EEGTRQAPSSQGRQEGTRQAPSAQGHCEEGARQAASSQGCGCGEAGQAASSSQGCRYCEARQASSSQGCGEQDGKAASGEEAGPPVTGEFHSFSKGEEGALGPPSRDRTPPGHTLSRSLNPSAGPIPEARPAASASARTRPTKPSSWASLSGAAASIRMVDGHWLRWHSRARILVSTCRSTASRWSTSSASNRRIRPGRCAGRCCSGK